MKKTINFKLNLSDMTDFKYQKPSLPTYEECVDITKHCESFFGKTETVDGVTFSMFSYRLPSYGDFVDAGKNGINGFELRGLTFMHPTNDNKEYIRYLMLHKFFNVNQTEVTLEKNLTDEIVSVYEKLDGSMIRFIELPGGKIVAKTKMAFESPQAISATKWLHDHPNLLEIVRSTLRNRIVLIFEWLSPDNQIVVPHAQRTLRLLQARDEITGEYLDIQHYEFEKAREIIPTPSLEDLLQMAKTTKDEEGWVVRFANGLFIKVKTEWYTSLHKLFSGFKPRDIAQMVIEEKADDLFGIIAESHPMFASATKIYEQLTHYVNSEFRKIIDIARTASFSKDSNTGRKEFAQKYRTHPFFGIIMICITKGDEQGFKSFKDTLLKRVKTINSWNDFSAKNLNL